MARSRQTPVSEKYPLFNRQRAGNTGMHLLVLVMVVLSLWMLASFVGQIMTGAQLERRREELVAENARIEAENVALRNQVGYAESPAYAEQIAREQLGLAAEGDTVLLPTFEDVPAAQAEPTAVPLPAPTAQPNWRAWVDVLAGADRDR